MSQRKTTKTINVKIDAGLNDLRAHDYLPLPVAIEIATILGELSDPASSVDQSGVA